LNFGKEYFSKNECPYERNMFQANGAYTKSLPMVKLLKIAGLFFTGWGELYSIHVFAKGKKKTA
jgi:hypothetical protein